MTADVTKTPSSPAELRASHVAAWEAVTQELLADRLADAYDALIERMPPMPGGESWLDVATGTGPLALSAARAGANVTAFDFAARPIGTARARAAAEGLKLVIEQRALDHHRYVPEEFSAVVSAFGAMYALDHHHAASAMSMLAHPAGRIGLVSWAPGSLAARAFELVQPHTSVANGSNPFLWGEPAYLDHLFGGFWRFEHAVLDVSLGELSGEEVWRLFVEADAPTADAAQSMEVHERGTLALRFAEVVEDRRTTEGTVGLSILISVAHHPMP